MPFKFDLSEKGKTFHFEAETPSLIGKKLGETVRGEDIKSELAGYELRITGATTKAGFPARPELPGTGTKRILLGYGIGMREKRPKGLRKRKTVRGNVIAEDIAQVNLVVIKRGKKSLREIFGVGKEEKEAKETK